MSSGRAIDVSNDAYLAILTGGSGKLGTLGIRALAAKGIEEAVPEGIVYLRTDLSGKVKPYGGQSINYERFLVRQKEHARAFPESEFKFSVVGRANPGAELDAAEHRFVQELTESQRASQSPLVSNMRDPVGPLGRPSFGLDEPY